MNLNELKDEVKVGWGRTPTSSPLLLPEHAESCLRVKSEEYRGMKNGKPVLITLDEMGRVEYKVLLPDGHLGAVED